MMPDLERQTRITLYINVSGSTVSRMTLHELTVAEDDWKPRGSDWVIQCWVSQ
jgi:hypothetical protein